MSRGLWSRSAFPADQAHAMSIAELGASPTSRLCLELAIEIDVQHWPARERLRPDFRVERRRNPRWPVRGMATVLPLGVDLGVVVELDRLDGAPWWIGGDAVTPLRVGARVSVGFSAPEGRPATGEIMRCEPKADGRYRIAIRFDGGSPV